MTSAIGKRKTDPRRGLTLLEIILVMALAVVLVAMVAPNLARFSRSQVLRGEAQWVLEALRTGRDRAAAEATEYRLEVDPNGRSVRLTRNRGGLHIPAEGPAGRPRRMPEGVEIVLDRLDEQELSYVEMLPTGSQTPATIALTDSQGLGLRVQANSPFEPFVLQEGAGEDQP